MSGCDQLVLLPLSDMLCAVCAGCVESSAPTLGLPADAQGAGCVETGEEGEVSPTPAGRIASIYYLQVRRKWSWSLQPVEQ